MTIETFPERRMLLYLMSFILGPNRERCRRMLDENRARFEAAPGSSRNHQAWPGGYLDHVTDTMYVGKLHMSIYQTTEKIDDLPFTLSDVLLVMFLHDVEKPWKAEHAKSWVGKKGRHEFRLAKIAEYGIELGPQHMNALTYVEGEGDDYRPDMRVMNELAAFCHVCDVTSARIWHSKPLAPEGPIPPWGPVP